MTQDTSQAEPNAADAAAAEEAQEAEGFGDAFAERASDGEKDPTAGDKPAKSEPAPAGSEAAPSDDEAAGAKHQAEPAQAPDPLEGLTPEQRQYVERLQASERSQRGRVGALTKKLNQYGRTVEAPSQAKREEQPREAAEGEAPKASDLEARLDAAAEEYGDVNGPLVEAIKGLKAEMAEMKPKVDQADLAQTQAEINAAYDTLGSKHPDYVELANNSDFIGWAQAQPPAVQGLISSFDPDEVSLGLTLFKAERNASYQAYEVGNEGSDAGTASGDRRARQLDGSRQVRHRGAPAASGVPNEFGTAFKARASQPV